MSRPLLLVFASLWLAGCPNSGGSGAGITPPPQVFMTVSSATVLSPSITGTTSVNGCVNVAGVEIIGPDQAFIVNANYTVSPSPWEIQGASLNRYFAKGGFALSISLTAKVTCDDSRTNFSQPVSVTFFPTQGVLSTGNQVLPDAFVAQGGRDGSPVTFIGCVAVSGGGFALARVDTTGRIISSRGLLPVDCSANSDIRERVPLPPKGLRWLLEYGKGAYAFDDDLAVSNTVKLSVKRLGVGSDGSALIWVEDGAGMALIEYVTPTPVSSSQPHRWAVAFPAVMISDPIVDVANGWGYAASWQGNGSMREIVVLKYNLADGTVLNAIDNKVPVLISQDIGELNTPIQPGAAFNVDGSLLYVSLLTVDPNQNVASTVLACATNVGGCQGTSRRWQSESLKAQVGNLLPFSTDFLAAISDSQVIFLSASDGTVKNLGGRGLRPGGGLKTLLVQQGRGSDFYVFNGPANGYPNEIVATDAPSSGELWRLAVGNGSTPVTGMWLALDDSGQPWLRVGPNQVKPLKNAEYRSARGP